MTHGERVKEIRKSLNLTLEAFGDKLGVRKTSISKIEHDEVSLSSQMAAGICRTYNVNYDYLMYGEGEMFTDIPQTVLDELCKQYECDATDRNLIEEYLKLDAASRKVLKDYIKAVFMHE